MRTSKSELNIAYYHLNFVLKFKENVLANNSGYTKKSNCTRKLLKCIIYSGAKFEII